MYLNAAPGVPVCGPSGASAHVRGVVEAWRPDAVVCARKVDHRGEAERCSVPIIETGVPGWPSWASSWRDYTEVLAARRVARAAARWSPTVVWERHSLYSDAGWKLANNFGCRWILEVNAPLVEERTRYGSVRHPAWARGWERDVLQAAPEILAVSTWVQRWLTDEIGCAGVRHVPNGVADVIGDRERTRQELGVDSRFVIGFLGSLKPWHGVERLPLLLDALPEAVGLLVGSGPVSVDHPRLRRVGQVSERRAADLCAAMDVGIAPYGPDAPPWFSPLKLPAYRAQGTPSVAADIGDCRGVVGDGGTVLPAGASVADWVDAVRSWRGRRVARVVRSWADVVAQVGV